MEEPEDRISQVLAECDETLRTLASQGRLTVEALQAFAALSRSVRSELERRTRGERRAADRSTPDRRASILIGT